jgi:hypothetical protein
MNTNTEIKTLDQRIKPGAWLIKGETGNILAASMQECSDLRAEIARLQAAMADANRKNLELSRVNHEQRLQEQRLEQALADRNAKHAPSDDLDTVHKFLLGEGALDGFHFGDSDTERPRPAYWWRKNLRAALAQRLGCGEPVAWCVDNPSGNGVLIYGNGAVLKADDNLYLTTPPAAVADADKRDAKRLAVESEFAALIPDTYYMDQPDGGSVTVQEQVRRIVEYAERYRWLRNPGTDVALVLDKRGEWIPEDDLIAGIGGYYVYEYRAGEELDSEIDAVIAASAKESK